MSNPVFRVMLRFDIKPGMEEDFEKTWLSIGHVITEHPANLGQWLLRVDEELPARENPPSSYFVISDWVDEPQFREFEHSDAHVEHRKKLHPFRNGGAMWTMNVVHALPKSPVGASS